MPLELALDTFGDIQNDAEGHPLPADRVIRNILDQAVLADQAGVDFFGLGEHHRGDFAVSAPEPILGAIAARTTRLRFGTAVTVLSSDDPVRLFQRFSTLAALSQGRAEVILGRGSFTESFPLFGYDLADYETLFEEKLDLFAALLRGGPVTWSGTTRAALDRQRVVPDLPPQGLKCWIGVGGSPDSVVRAVRYRMPMMLAIIGGPAARFRPYADLYREAHARQGTEPPGLGVHSPGHVADSDEEARDQLWPRYRVLHDRIGRERGWPAMTRAQFDREADAGALYVGSPETVARRIAGTVRLLGLDRFELKFASGPMPQGELLRSIELYGTRVAPMVRDLLA